MDAETKLKQAAQVDDQTPLAGDLLWGVKGIAVEIDRTERQTYHLLTTGQLPAQLVGGRWVASDPDCATASPKSWAEPLSGLELGLR